MTRKRNKHVAYAGVAAVTCLAFVSGCGSGVTQYSPQLRARGELTLRYDDGFSMTAEGKEIASGVTWGGLSEYVKCVPKAKEHADAAQAEGAAAVSMSWIGAGIGLGSLGSLGGLVVYDKDPDLAGAILGIGVAAAITGVVLAAVGRNRKNHANGHAVDAMNYYNDEVGSYGGTCKTPAAPLPQVEPKAKPAQTATDPAEPAEPAQPDPRDTPPPPPPTPEQPPSDQI
ncbi:MAG: hypothetical protein R3B70_10495 [Polyangiaceae bacterium]